MHRTAHLGFEPRVSWSRAMRVASYTNEQIEATSEEFRLATPLMNCRLPYVQSWTQRGVEKQTPEVAVRIKAHFQKGVSSKHLL